MAALTASQNINAVTYAAGEAITFSPSVANPFIRLTIDAQVPADVSKIEGTLLGSITVESRAELYIVNTSTTTPLVVKLLDATKDLDISGRLKTRGAYISIGTGTGAYGQTISTVIGGKSIDYPPFVEVETAAGSGVYVQMLNIQGNYQNDASVVPTYYKNFSKVGTTPEIGCFFEYDELNRTIHFADATGGWVPPSGANIRIPNIHITSAGVPVVPNANGSRFTASGHIDMDTTMLSNRFAAGFTSSFLSLSMVNANFPRWINLQFVKGSIYIRNSCSPLCVYENNYCIAVGGAYGNLDIDGFKLCSATSGTNSLSIGAGAVKNYFTYLFDRSIAYAPALYVQGVASDTSAKRIENLYCAGGQVIFREANNLVVKGLYLSDRMNSTYSTANAYSGFEVGPNFVNATIQTIRKIPGGVQPYTGWFRVGNMSARNVAIHDFDLDCVNLTQTGFVLAGGNRFWIANGSINNPATSINTDGAPNTSGAVPNRMQNVTSTGTKPVYNAVGYQYSMVKVGLHKAYTNSNGSADVDMLHVVYTSGTAGTMHLNVGSPNNKRVLYEVVSGVPDIDYKFTDKSITMLTASAEIIWTSLWPARGITSFTGCAATAFAGSYAYFKMRPANQGAEWPTSWTAWSAANLTSEFNALVGYDSTEGLDMQVRAVGTGGNITSVTALAVSGLTVDTAFAPFDVGFVEVSVLGGESGAVVGVIDTVSGDVLRAFETLGASGSKVIDYPYNFDNGIERSYRLVSRKVGYLQSVTTGNVGQTGATIPVPMVVAHSATNAAVVGVVLNGAAKTITVTGSKTFLDVYQHSQWWATQRANMVYDLPMESLDGQTFEVPATWKISWAMPSDKTLSGGWLLLSTPGTLNYKLSGTKTEFQTAGNYDMGGTVFGGTVEFVNTSGGAVTVSVPGGTSYTNTGPNITVTTPQPALTIGLPGTGFDVVVLQAGTSTVLASVDAEPTSSWSYTYSTLQNVDIGIFKPGYVPTYVRNYSLTALNATLPITAPVDRNYA